MPDLYGYYTTVGAGVAGLPLYDTLQCPPIDATNSCTYDSSIRAMRCSPTSRRSPPGRTSPYATMAGSTTILFYTEWTARGGVTGLGRPVDVETAVTAT